ncbi:MAG: polyisoprenoid-binding protein [Acidocella sp. 20-63-7]|nr:MAG: polyisoprenoid-binding protein [Acidocella sp. 20-63-7]HQT46815.1 YceI family protein [Acidocella sp.]
MKRPVLALALACLSASPALAANWAVQPAQSTLGFSGVQTSAPFSGNFTQWTAQINFDPANPAAAHVKITINTASAKTGDTQRDTALPDADWFDAAAFPQAVFEATGFTPEGGTKYQTTGTLTIRGISQKLTLPFTLVITGNQAIAKGHITLQRAAFGVGQGDWAKGDWVGLTAGVNFTLVATQQ